MNNMLSSDGSRQNESSSENDNNTHVLSKKGQNDSSEWDMLGLGGQNSI